VTLELLASEVMGYLMMLRWCEVLDFRCQLQHEQQLAHHQQLTNCATGDRPSLAHDGALEQEELQPAAVSRSTRHREVASQLVHKSGFDIVAGNLKGYVIVS
jgi:hypothetical protein